MSTLIFAERQVLEDLFEMKGGYVLDFSNYTFADFFRSDFSIDIYSTEFDGYGSSKANRMRGFWRVAHDNLVGRVTHALITYCEAKSKAELVTQARRIADRLLESPLVVNFDELSIDFSDSLLQRYAEATRKLIAEGAYSDAIDRMHTTTLLYLRRICQDRGLNYSDKDPLQSLAGKYVRHIRSTDELETEMSESIVRSSISILDRFNPVRNDQSMAHANEPVGDAEAQFIVSSVIALLRFFRAIERNRKATESMDDELDVPF